MNSSNPLVITLLGPTASGKTALALEIAERLELPVINVDSRQLYQEMDIGTAKPTAKQQARVRHHLLDLRSPDQPITLQEFQAEANPCIKRELEHRGVALLVGGSGLYLKALTSGLQPPTSRAMPLCSSSRLMQGLAAAWNSCSVIGWSGARRSSRWCRTRACCSAVGLAVPMSISR